MATLATDMLATRARRLLAAGIVAACALVFVAAVFPQCLHDPFWQVDPMAARLAQPRRGIAAAPTSVGA